MNITLENVYFLIYGAILWWILWCFYQIVSTLLNGKKTYLSIKERDKAIDLLQGKGFTVYKASPKFQQSMEIKDYETAVKLSMDNYLVFSDKHGLEMNLMKVRPTKDDLVRERRAQIKIVK